jgi:hypothetical protein
MEIEKRRAMRMSLASVFGAVILFCVGTAPCFAQASNLGSVKKIYVGSIGQSDEAERFRLLLEDELGKVGFSTIDDAKSADAVLTGALSVRVYAEESRARVTVILKTPDGVRLWGKDFEPHVKFGGTKDSVKLRAQDVAKTLRKDVDKAK